jgi:pimeloyl-ACP methyl ester carboxylesterase
MHQIVSELHAGLRKARIKGPYVFVGHSFGGLLSRVYASKYPQDVAGIVLVDSSHEDMQIMMNNKPTLLRELSRGRDIPPVQTRFTAPAPTASQSGQEAPAAATKVDPPFDQLPQDSQVIRLWATSQPKYSDARRSEFDYLAEEMVLLHAERAGAEFPLGDKPLIVLTRGKNLSEGHSGRQVDLLRLSRNSAQVIVEESGHHVHLDDPEAVAQAVRQVVNAARTGGTVR